MGHKTLYNKSWDTVYDYLNHPGDPTKHQQFYTAVEPIIKHWLLRLGIKDDLDGHAKSIFSDLFLKELKRFRSGKLVREKCTAKITTYYFPVIKNLCLDYIKVLSSETYFTEDYAELDVTAEIGVFDSIWGEHKNMVLTEMSRHIKEWIEFSGFVAAKRDVLRKRFIEGRKFPDILRGVDKNVFEAQRKWACRQGKKIASIIAEILLPAFIDFHRLPISKNIDPRLIEKYLLGLRTKLAR
jgi:hypothetical protein